MGVSMHWLHFLCLLLYLANDCVSRRIFGYSPNCKADAREPWSYRGRNGPRYWGESYPQCNGHEQSPIAIHSQEVIPNESLTKLDMRNYDHPLTRATIENNGHTVQVTPADGIDRTLYVNGDSYRLTQFHFHWGDNKKRGAEHIVDGTQHSMELHLVHQNSNNQVAVVGVFFQEQSRKNPDFQPIIDVLPHIKYKDMRTELKSSLKLINLLPSNPSSFYRYQGSLTTPDCAEGVIWSVMTKVLPVGSNQMNELHKLYSATRSEATRQCKISNNYRPIQPLNHRPVYISH